MSSIQPKISQGTPQPVGTWRVGSAVAASAAALALAVFAGQWISALPNDMQNLNADPACQKVEQHIENESFKVLRTNWLGILESQTRQRDLTSAVFECRRPGGVLTQTVEERGDLRGLTDIKGQALTEPDLKKMDVSLVLDVANWRKNRDPQTESTAPSPTPGKLPSAPR